jgi:MFS family permease
MIKHQELRYSLQKNKFWFHFFLISLLSGTGFGLSRVVTVLYAMELGSTPYQLGTVASAQNIGLLLMALPIGILIEQFGPLKLFIFGSLLIGSGYILTPQFSSPFSLILTTTFISFFMSFRFVSLNTIFMSQLSIIGDEKAGWMRANSLIGVLLIGPALATIIVVGLGFSGAFYCISAIFLMTIFEAPSVFNGYKTSQNIKRKLSFDELLKQLRNIIIEKDLRAICLIEFFLQATISYFSFFIVPIAVSVFHIPAHAATKLISTEGIAFIIALFFLGRSIPAYGLAKVYLISLLLSILSLIIAGLTISEWILWFACLSLGLSLGLLQTVNLSGFSRISQVYGHGNIAGVIALVGPAGGLAGGFLGGVWGDYFSLQSAFLLLAIPLFYSASCLFFRNRYSLSSLN